MGYHPTTKSREYREGWVGRRRTYICRGCGQKFQEDRREALPIKERYCLNCQASADIETTKICGICHKRKPFDDSRWRRVKDNDYPPVSACHECAAESEGKNGVLIYSV